MSSEAAAARVRAVLFALADLAPSGEAQRGPGRTVPLDWFRWIWANAAHLLLRDDAADAAGPALEPDFGERLAAVDQIRPEQASLRVGWLFVAGRVRDEVGRAERVLHPLVTIPVRVRRPSAYEDPTLVPAGDAELSPLIADDAVRQRLEADLDTGMGSGAVGDGVRLAPTRAVLESMPTLRAWALDAAAAAGFDVDRVVPAGEPPEKLMRADELVVVAGSAVYAVHETGGTNRAASLRAWTPLPLTEPTAFSTIYADYAPPPAESREEPESPFLLTRAQREAVAASRTEPLTVVSGAPGTGKSQTVVAIACDALARGETVLVAARSDATVDALLGLLERAPGPRPVVFGSNERRLALARRLASGTSPVPRWKVAAAEQSLESAVTAREAVRRGLVARLTAHLLSSGDPEVAAVRDAGPLLFEPGAPLDEVEARLRRVAWRGGRGWGARWALRKARRLAGSPEGDATSLLAAVNLARAVAAARAADTSAALPPTGDYRALVAAEDRVRDLAARWLDLSSRSEARYDGDARASVAALATALRSGRAARRAQLARLDRPLTRALPLWVGSLPDIDDLLPQAPGLFDLVVLDEASSIDQPLAAPALLRARRAVVVGDPKQLRHVSFLADSQLATVLSANGLADDPLLSATLDVRRNSAFDVAAGAAPVVTLDEHFRSRPHLVDFVARRIYGGEFAVAKRSPATESLDCIHAEVIEGRRGRSGVVQAEVEAVVAHLRALRSSGATSVGVVSPFRVQADALESAVLGAFGADDLIAMNLRVGTVHAFQGNERDHVLVSLGIGPGGSAASWRFVEDPHLFAVLATRAREDLTLLRSADPRPNGLLAGYLAQADVAPGRPSPGPVSEWASTLASELAAAGVDVVPGYPAGRDRVDVCVYARTPVAVVADLHPGGPAAHVERCASLLRLGWEVVEALPRPYAPFTPSEVVAALAARLRP